MNEIKTKLFFLILFIIGLAAIIFLYNPPEYLNNLGSSNTTVNQGNQSNSNFVVNNNSQPETPATLPIRSITVGNILIPIEIADTEAARIKGLSGLPSIPLQTGLFFIFDKASYQGVWMKDMLFSLDLIWFDETYSIIQIDKNISPNTYPTIFTPNRPAKYLLEVNAGFADRNGIRVGDKITASR
jgi:hypothetical protein